ncbi:hypothetical protein ANCCAN_14731 [Ancylostoma caninum]|uniref:Reverse transcriptase domain-containing protein n=1 Tax=Ancylostoma caninum TaxID=29170 RepID=A0A368G8J7_ANCCA|nr:hypothetical protein ANCCAN_14731 [Ancylostoma caninum]
MLDGVTENSNTKISKEQALMSILKEKNVLTADLRAMLQEFIDVFAVSDRELTQTDLVVHDIDTGDANPINQKIRPGPIGARKEFKGIIKDLLERGVVEKSQSEWIS